MISIDQMLLSYMSSRCDVSSQHKLPGREELHSCVSLSFWDYEAIDRAIDRAIDSMLADGRLIAYDPYLSDHEIDVL